MILCPLGISPLANSQKGILWDLVPPIVIISIFAQVQQFITATVKMVTIGSHLEIISEIENFILKSISEISATRKPAEIKINIRRLIIKYRAESSVKVFRVSVIFSLFSVLMIVIERKWNGPAYFEASTRWRWRSSQQWIFN